MKRFIMICGLFLMVAVFAIAQEGTAEKSLVDQAIVDAILASGILGVGVSALTEMIKRLLNATGVLAYVISGVVSAASTAYYLTAVAHMFTILNFVIYSVLVFLTANGLYKMVAKTGK